jgi:3D (Asp-Asp-Asp) domain-containing protein/LysM repeat protein
MKKSFLSIIAATALIITEGVHAQAEEVIVKKGDTLWSFSQKHGVTVDDLKEWNDLISDMIYPDQSLTISPEENYKVVSGDSLWEIGEKFGVTVDQLKEWNKLSDDKIFPDQELVILKDTPKFNTPSGTPKKQQPSVDNSKSETTNKVVKSNNVAKSETTNKNEKSDVVTKSKPTIKEQKSDEVAKELTVTATAYTANCEGCSGTTATGVDLKANPDAKVIAVDPNVIPLGSKVYVEGYGYATAEDTGGAIKGNKIDLFIPSEDEAKEWGKRKVTVKVLHE